MNVAQTNSNSPLRCASLLLPCPQIPTILRLATLPVMILLSLSKIQSDVCSFIIMALMAVTNGYCSTLTLIYGPPRVPEEIRELSGIIIGTTIQAGILGGSLIALGVK